LKRTPLHAAHVALGARLVEFGGWEMPVWYEGILSEHEAVRTRVGLFDVSHMGELVVYGHAAEVGLQRLLTNDLSKLDADEAQYTLLPNEAGGTIDDLLAYRLADSVFLLVVNAANIDADREWLRAHLPAAASIDDHSGAKSLLALQGPLAPAVLSGVTRLPVWSMGYYRFARGTVAGAEALVSRTGYTGEDGFEIMVENEYAMAVWEALMTAGAEHGIAPAGLGARDSLRLEAAMPLYGHELDEETSAIEAGLKRFVSLDKPGSSGDMVGGERLRRELEEGVSKKLVGIELSGPGVAREGYAITSEGRPVGRVTSGTRSPTLEKSIAMGYVDPEHGRLGTALEVDIRGRAVPATVVRRPFYRRERQPA